MTASAEPFDQRESVAGEIGAIREAADNQPQPALEGLECPAGNPGISLGFGRQFATDDDGVHRPGGPGLA